MDPKKMMKQMVDFNRTTFDNGFNAMVLVQEQMEKAQKTFLDQAAWLPEEGRKALGEWVSSCKKGRENFKTVVEDGFRKVESYFAGAAGCSM